MSTLTIPVQTEQTLTGTYAKFGNDLYFISEEPDLFPPNPREDWDCYSTFYIVPNRYFSGDKPVSAFALMSKPALNLSTLNSLSMPTFTPPSLSLLHRSMMILIPALPVSPSAPART